MSLFLLIVAFVCTGLNQISNKALLMMGLNDYRDIYFIGFWGTGLILGLIVWAVTRHGVRRDDVFIGLGMGAVGAIAGFFLLAAMESVPTFVAFPVRSCGNIAVTAAVSYVIWREDVTRAQWLGIVCGIASIYLLAVK